MFNKTTRMTDVEDFLRVITRNKSAFIIPFVLFKKNSITREIFFIRSYGADNEWKILIGVRLLDRSGDLSICLVQKNFKWTSIMGKNFSLFGRELVKISKFLIAQLLMDHPVQETNTRAWFSDFFWFFSHSDRHEAKKIAHFHERKQVYEVRT